VLIDGYEEGEDRLSSVGGVGSVVTADEFKCGWAIVFISCD